MIERKKRFEDVLREAALKQIEDDHRREKRVRCEVAEYVEGKRDFSTLSIKAMELIYREKEKLQAPAPKKNEKDGLMKFFNVFMTICFVIIGSVIFCTGYAILTR